MKLFALASATAVTGRRTWRVDTPAPGFVNEQGGYWADQTSDQSRHYQQPPQPSYQQQFQKPQCAHGYDFYAPGEAVAVYMEQVGENDEKPVYSGWFNGEEKFLYWEWDRQSNSSNAIVQAVAGNWFFGPIVGDVQNAISSSTTYGLRHCPTDEEVEWIQFNTNIDHIVSMKASQPTSSFNQMMPYPHDYFQCCEKFTWTNGDAKPITMKNSWQKSKHGRYYYTDEKSIAEHFLYFQFDSDADSIHWKSRPGRWYIGTRLDDPESALFKTVKFDENFVTDPKMFRNGVDLCPNDPVYTLWEGKIPTGPDAFNFQCQRKPWERQDPVPVKTCAMKMDTNMFYGNSGSKNQDLCKLEDVINDIVSTQKNQLIFYRPDSNGKVDQYFPEIVNAIRQLRLQKCMRTIDATENRVGDYVRGCSGVCDQIKNIDFPNDITPVFHMIMKAFWANIDIWDGNYKDCKREVNKLASSINALRQFTGVNVKTSG